MPINLPPDFFPRLNGFLQPFMSDNDEREAWLTQAFFLREPRLFHQIDRAGSSMVFTTKCIQKLLTFECLAEPREHALAILLNTIRPGCGTQQQRDIDVFIAQLNSLCMDPAPIANILEQPPLPPENLAQSLDTPNAERSPTVFISYSHDDKAYAERLIRDLQSAGHAIWIDVSRLKGGDQWIRAISEGIINSYAFVVLATHRALASQWVRDEITWAKLRGKPIIPVLLEDVVDNNDFFALASYQGVKFHDAEYSTAFRALLTSLPAPAVPGDLPIQPPKLTRRTLELQYLDRLRFEVLLNTERYTPLSGISQRRSEPSTGVPFILMRPEYALLGREPAQEIRRFDNAVEELLALRQAVVLGEPGAGKTTTLWKLARELVDAAIIDEKKPIPLVLRLGNWTDEGQSLKDFIKSELGSLGVHVDDLLKEERAALLLDGLNEIPVSQRERENRDRQIQDLFRKHLTLITLLTCRAQDYTLDLGFDKIEITPLDELRIREFCVRYLGDEAGIALFERLNGPEVAQTEQDFYDSNEGRYQNYGRKTYLRQKKHTASLLVLAHNPYMLSMLTQVYVANQGRLPDNRGGLFHDFALTLLVRERLIKIDAQKRPILNAEAEALLDGLARLAYAMQIERGTASEGNALTVIPLAQVHKFLSDQQVYRAGSASLIAIGDSVRFSHQLLQEYFAARYMDNEIRAERLKASEIWPPDRWWKRTNWEEAAILLAGFYSDDCTPVLDWLAHANPEVAALCITRSGATTPDVTKNRLRDLWLPRLTDLRRDPQPAARAAVGRGLGRLTIGSLPADNRKGVSVIVLGGVKLPDLDWVKIPGGQFFYGDYGRQADLDSFSISRYLVTYAQFQAFLDDSVGFVDLRMWNGLAANQERHHNQNTPGEQQFRFWNHPRDNVSGFEAVAFCRWLTARMRAAGQIGAEAVIRLPTEFEWERAARGVSGLLYPYGNDFDPEKGNTEETGIGQTSAVGIFPNGASPEGVLDLSGNVWEWCLSDRDKPALDAEKEDQSFPSVRVLRGGPWNGYHAHARATFCYHSQPHFRDSNNGFRVVLSSLL